jgi:aspartate-semialdehyde dehydrogenase
MAQCHRVPVTFGHTATLNLEFKHKVDFDKILLGLRIFGAETGRLKLYETGIHPQPKFDLGPIDTVVHIGRIKINQSENKLGLVVLGHNLVRGAAALALDNLEALKNLNLD